MGTVDAAYAACATDGDFAEGRPSDPLPGLGLTVGNRSNGLTGETLVPGIGGSPVSGGSPVCGGTALDGTGAVVALGATTTSVADAENDSAPLADAFAVNCTCAAGGALVATGTDASSSKTWPSARLLILQVAPLADGQIVKLGDPR